MAPDCIGEEVRKRANGLADGGVLMLENVRFHPEEEKNDPGFAERLIQDEALQKQVVFELVAMAAGPPDPKIRPKLQEALDRYVPELALPASMVVEHVRVYRADASA